MKELCVSGDGDAASVSTVVVTAGGLASKKAAVGPLWERMTSLWPRLFQSD